MLSHTVLLTDDEEGVRKFVRTILRNHGFEVVEAADGVEALERLRELGPGLDLLVTDVRMPRMDGVSLAAASHALYPDLPVLFISGYGLDMEAERGKRPNGVCGYVRKPFLPKDLLEAVRNCLNPPKKNVVSAG